MFDLYCICMCVCVCMIQYGVESSNLYLYDLIHQVFSTTR